MEYTMELFYFPNKCQSTLCYTINYILCCSLSVVFLLDNSVTSGNCSHGDLRLEGGAYPSEGRLEICINNAWGAVCDRQFDDVDAQVACLQLGGFTTSGEIAHVCLQCWWIKIY